MDKNEAKNSWLGCQLPLFKAFLAKKCLGTIWELFVRNLATIFFRSLATLGRNIAFIAFYSQLDDYIGLENRESWTNEESDLFKSAESDSNWTRKIDFWHSLHFYLQNFTDFDLV